MASPGGASTATAAARRRPARAAASAPSSTRCSTARRARRLWSPEARGGVARGARRPRRPVRLERRARGARRRPPAARARRGDAAPRATTTAATRAARAFARARARARALSEGDDDDEEEDEEDADEEAPRQTSAEAAARERAEELDRVAGLPFREKHLWLEKRLEDLRCAPSEGYVRLEIRRHCLLEDSVHQVLGLEPRSLRQWMRVQFVDEPGIDVGGIEREWFGLASEAVFDPAVGVFRQAAGDGGLVFDASASLPAKLGGHPRARELYEFAGRLLAKALVERIPVAAPLSLPLYKQLVGAPLEYDDLECLDPDLCRNLDWLLHNDGVDALDLDFSVATPRTCPFGGADPDALGDDDDDGEDRDVDAVSYVLDTNLAIRELCERGRDVKVTDRNKRTYVDALWRHHVLEAHKDATWHLAKGVYSVLPPDLLAVFDAYELELLMCGSPTIDVADWAKHTEYAGEYRRRGDRHAVIAWFWKARNDGKYQRFCIQSLPRNELRFPRAHTCFNRIDLPLYSSYAELEAGLKVLIAMDATGFTMD
ncbi:ubiquitin protein ligase [Aureococcus anophagefferens]|uniref:HECT-type E3 ubiquitin transferase n=1 Tax=Aureococcus anophagefferens TaxID=44056 RepID=A0ABR1FWG3_AURAN